MSLAPSSSTQSAPDAELKTALSKPTWAELGAWLRVPCGVVLLGLLAWQASTTDGFSRLVAGGFHAAWLGLAALLLLVSLSVSFVRWWLVARAADLPLGGGEAFRFGALGFAANFVALGNVGGDLLKGTLLAKNRPGKRAVAVSTVLVDRLFGLFALLLLASAAILITQSATQATTTTADSAIRMLSRSTLAVTGIAIVMVTLVVAPGRLLVRIAELGRRLPGIGPLLVRGALLADRYRAGRGMLLLALMIGLAGDGAFIGSFYAVAQALPMNAPSLLEHFFVVPMAMIAGALPISPSGLGTVEGAVELLYQGLNPQARDEGSSKIAVGDGALIAFGHRLLMLAAGGVAVFYYFAARRSQATDLASETAPIIP